MTVRPLTKRDVGFLTCACKDFPDAWNEEMLLSAFRAGNFYGFIAEEKTDGKITPVGFITFSMHVDTADLEDLFVEKTFRGQGIGKALIIKFIESAAKNGAKTLFLEVRESNFVAEKLYLSMGFSKLSVRKKYYFDGENAVVLKKEL